MYIFPFCENVDTHDYIENFEIYFRKESVDLVYPVIFHLLFGTQVEKTFPSNVV